MTTGEFDNDLLGTIYCAYNNFPQDILTYLKTQDLCTGDSYSMNSQLEVMIDNTEFTPDQRYLVKAGYDEKHDAWAAKHREDFDYQDSHDLHPFSSAGEKNSIYFKNKKGCRMVNYLILIIGEELLQ